MRHGKYPFVIGFLIAPVALYSVFVLSPYVQTIRLSFTSWRGFAPPKNIGIDNYRRMMHDHRFWQALTHHGILLVALPLITIAIALVFAFLLNVAGRSRGGALRGVWGSKFYRVVFFLPQVLAISIIGVLFQTVYRPNESGLINGMLMKAGAKPIGFMIDPKLALPSLIGVLVWQAVGFYVVLFSAGMGSIANEIYEAAALDGATRVTLFFRITVPLLWSTIQVAWVYLGIAAFDAFALVNIMSVDRGGPDGATSVISLMIYRNAFEYSQAGYASALGVVLFFLTLTFAALTLRVTRRDAIEG